MVKKKFKLAFTKKSLDISILVQTAVGYDYRSSVYNDKEDRDPDLIRQPEDRGFN